MVCVMTIETYRGVKIKAIKGKGAEWGYVKLWINGVPQGREMGIDEAKTVANQHGWIDAAIAEPDRYAPEWQPGYRAPKN